MNAQPAEKKQLEEALEVLCVRRKQADYFPQQPRHDCLFYRGRWHYRCSCPECRKNRADDIGI